MKTYVYVIENNDDIKIGISSEIPKRVKSLQTGSSSKLEVAGYVECEDRAKALALEKRLHIEYSSYRTIGEWFKLASYKVLTDLLKTENVWVKAYKGTFLTQNKNRYSFYGNSSPLNETYYQELISL